MEMGVLVTLGLLDILQARCGEGCIHLIGRVYGSNAEGNFYAMSSFASFRVVELGGV
jgi:hypothetical protein